MIIEDGSQVSGANSYVTPAELTAYVEAGGDSLSGNSSHLLTKSMRYVESLNFKGSKLTEDQPLQFPRYDFTIDGYYVEITTIPQELKDLQMAVALAIDSDADPLAVQERATKKEKVGDIEVEYMDDSFPVLTSPAIDAAASKLVQNSPFGFSGRTVRS